MKWGWMLAIWLSVGNGFALTPPWDKNDLHSAAAAIVIGTVGSPITCREKMEKNRCGKKGFYSVPMTVNKIFKGRSILKEGETVTLYFWHMYFKDGCVGDQAHDHSPGEVGKYYLGHHANGAWYPLHWSGVEMITEGSGPLPKCK